MATTKRIAPLELKKMPKNDGFPNEKKSLIPRHIPGPAKVYTNNIGRSRVPSLRWEQPEWDLAECGRIIDTESYVRRAFRNKKNLFVKEGYEFVGSRPERIQYIKRRIAQMEIATGTPFKILIGQTISSLIRTSNAFWIKVRNKEASGGKVRTTTDGRKLNPVAGYFIAPPETIRFKRDEFGKIKRYQQEIYGKTSKEFAPEDVVHFFFDKREGYAVGTPALVSVKDDIRALRRIEENVELLVYQHLFPLFHYKVGTEQNPAAVYSDGTTEVDEIQLKVASMPSDGCWVTPERHEVKPLQAGSSPVAVEKVIDHFKQRIFTGLGNSSVDMGEGGTANRSTADTMSRNLIDDTKADQKEFASQFEAFIINELLLESTFSDATILDEENLVRLKFKEIDFESRMAKENHYSQMFLQNAITHSELRQGIGREPFIGQGWPTANKKTTMFTKGDGDWASTAYGLIERDKIILQSIDEPGTAEGKAVAASTVKKNSSSSSANAGANKNKPANQHGTRPAAKLNKDSFGETNRIASLDVIFKQEAPLQTIYDNLRGDVLMQIKTRGYKEREMKFLIDSSFSRAKEKLVSLAQRAYRIGLSDTGANVWDVRIDKADGKIHDHIDRYIGKLRDHLISRMNKNTIKTNSLRQEDSLLVGLVFDALRHRTAMIDNSEIMRAYNYGTASGFRSTGFKEIHSKRNGSHPCVICDKHILVYRESDVIIYDELPPFHPNCTCSLTKE